MEFANRIKTLTPSATLAITALANELKAKGVDVIGLGAGEPDFNTPREIIDAAYKALLDGHTKYTPAGGLPELKNAICEKYSNEFLEPQLYSLIINSCVDSTNLRVKYPASAVFNAVSKIPFLAP